MFPVYVKIQEDHEKSRNVFLRLSGMVALITFPMMSGLMVIAEPFIITVLGPKWDPLIILIIIFAPLGMTQSIIVGMAGIYQARGRTDWMFRWGLFSGTVTIIAFLIGLNWGISGIAAAYTIAGLLLAYPALYFPFKLIELEMKKLGSELWIPLAGSLLMTAVLLILKLFIPSHWPGTGVLAILFFSGCIVYLFFNMKLNRDWFQEIVKAF